MKMQLCEKYLTFPVNLNTVSKKVTITENGKLLFDFDCNLDMIAPNFTAYIDVARFSDKNVEINIEPEMEFDVGTAREMPLEKVGSELLRPQVHFTVPNGWNNDPNGLVLYEGKYHLFYQYNPASTQWGNMHWGHAVSPDLLHWEHCDVALFPDEMGTIFSGSAIEDVNNVSGLKSNGHNPFLLYYTAAPNNNIPSKDKKACQCLAYSTDGGKTFEKYAKNPVVKWIDGYNRDPKIVYISSLQKYLMIMYLDDDRYYMLTSHNLLDWAEYGEISIKRDDECPDIFMLECDGKAYWVIVGAHDNYVIGSFTDSGFVPEGQQKRICYSTASYAAQSFSGLPEGEAIRIAWIRTDIKGMPFSEQMGFPMRLSLTKRQGEIYLAGQPHENIRQLRKKTLEIKDSIICGAKKFGVGADPVEIELNMPYIDKTKLKLLIFGNCMTVDTEYNEIEFCGVKMPISVLNDKIDLHIVVDRCSVEYYADGGIFYSAVKCLCDYNLPYIELSSEDNVRIESFKCHALESVYKNENTLFR